MVEPSESFDYWRHLISDTFVPLTAEPVGGWGGDARIDHTQYAGLDVSTVHARGQHVRRTPALISRSDDAYLLASVQTAGHGVVMQDGRVAPLGPGEIAFYDSTRPYTLHFDAEFEQIVIQMPLAEVVALSGVKRLEAATARTLPASGVAQTVADFYRSFVSVQDSDPEGAQALAPAAGMLLVSALSVLTGVSHPADDGRALRREQAMTVLRCRLHESTLSVDDVAAELHVARRTLYRAFESEPDGLLGQLRQLRVARAQHLLRTRPSMTVAGVAEACGFGGPVQFHRVFRQVTGSTPTRARKDGTPG